VIPSPASVRILLVADTHLGLDYPLRPRIERRRRGDDFFANFEHSLRPALTGEVDMVIHGGDLLDRPHVSPDLAFLALAPLLRVASVGVPVFLVPGNHERSRLPYPLLSRHDNLHIFDRPRTFLWQGRGLTVALSGFPFQRHVRDGFAALAAATGHHSQPADIYLLCLHQTVEGAQVGPSRYTFRGGPDVVRGQDIPPAFAAVLSGHIHRAQQLNCDLRGRSLPAPVLYPGSIERTAFAERDEDKGCFRLQVDTAPGSPGRLAAVSFVRLPARPMVALELEPNGLTPAQLRRALLDGLTSLDPDAVVRIRVRGPVPAPLRPILAAPAVRALAPATMNITLAYDRPFVGPGRSQAS
jgi:exonuclease SbcD